jgi:hypothetical protein
MDNESPPPSRAELSKTPSWVMVGFVLGVLAVLGFQRERRPPAVEPEVVAPPAAAVTSPAAAGKTEPDERSITSLPDRPSLAVIEAVFSQWGGYALWENEATEVALWNSVTGDFTDFFEVLRSPSGFYFRSIPQLTRPWTDARPPRESPLRFTEPHEQRRARLEGRLAPKEPVTGATGPWKQEPATPAPKANYLPPAPASAQEGGL